MPFIYLVRSLCFWRLVCWTFTVSYQKQKSRKCPVPSISNYIFIVNLIMSLLLLSHNITDILGRSVGADKRSQDRSSDCRVCIPLPGLQSRGLSITVWDVTLPKSPYTRGRRRKSLFLSKAELVRCSFSSAHSYLRGHRAKGCHFGHHTRRT